MWRALLFVFLINCLAYNARGDIGDKYMGAKYINNPLGEAVKPDTDPLIRYDAFDCVTFIETVLADGNLDKLNKIRYADGKPDFIIRNHFIETDWLKNNSDLVKNVSAKYGKVAIRTVTIDKKNWFKTVHNINTNFTPQTVKLEYIPYSNAKNIRVSKPMIVLFVINNPKIRNKIGTDLAIQHMGFLMPNRQLRHASRSQKRVTDIDFNKYINTKVENKNNLGIMLLEIKK